MRREWIEIVVSSSMVTSVTCLPPCGGSGLKLKDILLGLDPKAVSLHAEGVD